MKIAMVSEHASPLAVLGSADAGGQNVHVAELARTLGRRGTEVVVHTRRDDASLPEWVDFAPGVRVHHVDAGPPVELPKDELLPHMTEFAARLREQWSADRPELVHAHFWMSGKAALDAASPLGIPVVHTFHALGVVKRRFQGAADTSPPEREALERRILRDADQIIATCSDETFELMRLGADRARLSIIPCGVDLQQFTPSGEAAPRSERFRLAAIGRLVERKGVGNTITALRDLPDVELVIAGGTDRALLHESLDGRRLERLAHEEGVADRVTMLGRQDRSEVAALLRSSDLLVSVPWYEPFGIVPIEAMACGVPVVASAVGGMIDTVIDGVTGRLVPPRDPQRLVEAIAALQADEPQRQELGRAGAARARRLFDWERIGGRTLDVYQRVLGRSAGHSRLATPALPENSRQHLVTLQRALDEAGPALARAEQLGTQLARVLGEGSRLLVIGNGGSAAQAQHLTAELVGRFMTERAPLSALCLHGDTSALTAITNDYGLTEMFARQVRAHGRPGDVLLAISTSGSSPNVLAAARAAHDCAIDVWAMTGPGPNPLTDLADEAICVPGTTTATIQELHMVVTHTLCGAVDLAIADSSASAQSREAARA